MFSDARVRAPPDLLGALVDERALRRVDQLATAPEPLDVRLWRAANFALKRHGTTGGARLLAQRADHFRRGTCCARLERVVGAV